MIDTFEKSKAPPVLGCGVVEKPEPIRDLLEWSFVTPASTYVVHLGELSNYHHDIEHKKRNYLLT